MNYQKSYLIALITAIVVKKVPDDKIVNYRKLRKIKINKFLQYAEAGKFRINRLPLNAADSCEKFSTLSTPRPISQPLRNLYKLYVLRLLLVEYHKIGVVYTLFYEQKACN